MPIAARRLATRPWPLNILAKVREWASQNERLRRENISLQKRVLELRLKAKGHSVKASRTFVSQHYRK